MTNQERLQAVTDIAERALAKWASWVQDELEGTDSYQVTMDDIQQQRRRLRDLLQDRK